MCVGNRGEELDPDSNFRTRTRKNSMQPVPATLPAHWHETPCKFSTYDSLLRWISVHSLFNSKLLRFFSLLFLCSALRFSFLWTVIFPPLLYASPRRLLWLYLWLGWVVVFPQSRAAYSNKSHSVSFPSPSNPVCRQHSSLSAAVKICMVRGMFSLRSLWGWFSNQRTDFARGLPLCWNSIRGKLSTGR